MGCDIHWFSETKRKDVWKCDQVHPPINETFGEAPEEDLPYFLETDRDYWLFGLLQPGVRTEWEWSFPVSSIKDINLSNEVAAVIRGWGIDAHSGGHLSREDIKNKLEELTILKTQHLIQPADMTPMLHHHVDALTTILANMTADVPDSDQRIIFFFDN